jgi:phage shock protein PspC (stress-responsive transcriptional regulator)|uniref:PspC domain-containing protein n=1 Tax=Ignavibacterium album TaxID=591197 RepID=A0A7V3E711_9BACT
MPSIQNDIKFTSEIFSERRLKMEKRLYRSYTDKMLGGVCGGLGEYFDIDPVIIRVLFVIAVLFGGGGILAYIILWIVIPQRPFTIPKYDSNSEIKNESQTGAQSENTFREFVVQKRKMNKNSLAGIILIFLGTLFLLDNFVPRFSFHDFWPLILIGIGFALILNARNNQYEVKQ